MGQSLPPWPRFHTCHWLFPCISISIDTHSFLAPLEFCVVGWVSLKLHSPWGEEWLDLNGESVHIPGDQT